MRIVLLGLAVSGAFARTAGAEACKPSVIVDGDAGVAASVRKELADRGLVTERAACPALRAELVSRDGEILVDVTDVAGRRMHRTVGTASEAVTLIESWVRSDLTTDLMLGFEPPPSPERPSPAPVHHDAEVVAVAQPPAPNRRDRLSGSISADAAMDASTTSWIGGTATLCVRVWRLCLGGTYHVRRSSGFDRDDSTMLGTLELPLHRGRIALVPGVGLGYGARTWNLSDGENQEQGSTTSARVEARFTLSYPIARRIFIDAVAAIDTSLATGEDQNQNDSTTDSTLFVRFGAGLRIGAL